MQNPDRSLSSPLPLPSVPSVSSVANRFDVAPYRKIYFACAKALALDDDLRHELNESLTGKSSTKDFTIADWRHVVAHLQRLRHQDVKPSRPRVRAASVQSAIPNPQSAMEPISPAQLEYLSLLASELPWRSTVEHFIRARLLCPMRKEHWSGQLEDLFHSEARNVIAALRNMRARTSPASTPLSTPSTSSTASEPAHA